MVRRALVARVAPLVLAAAVLGGLAAPAAAAPDPAPGAPSSGVYLGAWVDPGQRTPITQVEVAQLGDFEADLGRPLAIVHAYQGWTSLVSVNTLAAISDQGSIPMIDWACGDSDADILAGKDDPFITAYAQELAAFGRPLFLRWYWEPNFPNSPTFAHCISTLGPNGYVRAFQHIWSIFQAAGATNVAFVWSPGLGGDTSNLDAYYPGDKYVNWIGVDAYDRKHKGTAAFADVFSAYYKVWSKHHKPMVVSETGATTDQAAYLQGIGDDLPAQFPDIKAVVYFDSKSASNWSLTGAGLAAFRQLAASPTFAPPGDGG